MSSSRSLLVSRYVGLSVDLCEDLCKKVMYHMVIKAFLKPTYLPFFVKVMTVLTVVTVVIVVTVVTDKCVCNKNVTKKG